MKFCSSVLEDVSVVKSSGSSLIVKGHYGSFWELADEHSECFVKVGFENESFQVCCDLSPWLKAGFWLQEG